METKNNLIQALSRTLLQMMTKHARIEEIPVVFGKDVKLTPREIHVIQMVGEWENVNVTDLGVYANITKSAASQMTAKLEKKGFLKKSHVVDNNKELQLSLTTLGQKAFNAHEQIHGKHLTEVAQRLEAFSLQQLATTSVILETINEIMGERLSQLSEEKYFWER